MRCKQCGGTPIAVVKRKLCADCKRSYDREYWRKNKDRLNSQRSITKKKNRMRLYDNLRDYCKSNSCVSCGEDDFVVLEFDHIDPKDKNSSVSDMVKNGYSWDSIKLELKRCQVLCANCHRRRTSEQFGWYPDLQTTIGGSSPSPASLKEEIR